MPDEQPISPEPEALERQTAAESPHAETQALEAAAFETPGPETEVVATEAPMIDVHAPHGGVHTWKDFWIHLGTITLGLLIAISLEQSVEWVHHLHQRHQLEADLREEGEQNEQVAENDWPALDDVMAADAARLREVESVLAVRRKREPPFPAASFLPPPAAAVFQLPLSAVWSTATASASIDLLPRDVARSYTRLYLQVDLLQQLAFAGNSEENEVKAYECRFCDGTLPCQPDLSQMTDEQLGEYSGLLTRHFTLTQAVKNRVLILESQNELRLQGRTADRTSIRGALRKLRADHPDTFLRPLPGTK
jgi:hypothetical protein